jgi:hypothetical protein
MAKRQRVESDFVRLSLRLREALRRRLAAAAQDHKTTLNGEILDRLEVSFLHEETEKRHDQESLREARVELILEVIRQMSEDLKVFGEVYRRLSTEGLQPRDETKARRLDRGKPRVRGKRLSQAHDEKV